MCSIADTECLSTFLIFLSGQFEQQSHSNHGSSGTGVGSGPEHGTRRPIRLAVDDAAAYAASAAIATAATAATALTAATTSEPE